MANPIAATACRGARQSGRRPVQKVTESVIEPIRERPLEEARPSAVQDVLAGRFAIEHELGRGATGCVYAARDLALGRRVAIKLIECRPDVRKRERFRREARAVALVEHPNVLAIYDARLDDSRPFLVTELLKGQTLRHRLDQGPLTLRRALDLALQLARGLSAAHDRGVVHRDLKPSNLFVTCKGQLKILDFGIAKLFAQDPLIDCFQTEAGAIFGTVGYMSPEQLRGEPVDARSDIFAAGCLLFEMITGGQCFLRPSATETNFAILREEPPPLPDGTPSSLSDVVCRCLQKNATLRFQTGRELASALRRCHGKIVPLRRPLSGSGRSSRAPSDSSSKARRRWSA
jgi:serine/threonine protein kinase